jgi:hypothetical protein
MSATLASCYKFKPLVESRIFSLAACIGKTKKLSTVFLYFVVKDCSPMINQLTDLTDELNKTNDFTQFVISIRRGFKDLVCKV